MRFVQTKNDLEISILRILNGIPFQSKDEKLNCIELDVTLIKVSNLQANFSSDQVLQTQGPCFFVFSH